MSSENYNEEISSPHDSCVVRMELPEVIVCFGRMAKTTYFSWFLIPLSNHVEIMSALESAGLKVVPEPDGSRNYNGLKFGSDVVAFQSRRAMEPYNQKPVRIIGGPPSLRIAYLLAFIGKFQEYPVGIFDGDLRTIVRESV